MIDVPERLPIANIAADQGMKLQPNKVMVVDDSNSLRALIVGSLITRGFDVYSANGLESARTGLKTFKPDVVVLDLGLEDGDGNDLIEEIDAIGAVCLVVSSRAHVEDRIKSLSLGAEEFIIKPVNMEELFLRIRNIMKYRNSLKPSAQGNVANLGGVSVDLMSRRLLAHDSTPGDELTSSELKLLQVLGENPSSIQSRDRLYRLILGRKSFEASRALDMLVSKLRKKLRATGSGLDIVSVRGEGYALRSSEPQDSSGTDE